MKKDAILRFEPIYKSTVWGGRRMGPLLDRELPGDGPIGESWELVDLPGDQSVVASGELAGRSLEALIAEDAERILGGAGLLDGRFPLLFKFIDANSTLSVQVHPDEAACARMGKGARPKTEAWYVIEARDDAALYVGLRPGVDREVFSDALEKGTVEELLHRMPVAPGDFVFLPAGTVHAIGEGIVLAEVQQSSATTYRVFDWNRVGLDGKPRQLHIEEALESTDFSRVGPPEIAAPPSGRPGLVCPFFELEILAGDGQILEGKGPLALMGVGGAGTAKVAAGDATEHISLGQTLFVLPGSSGRVELSGADDLSILATRVPSAVDPT